MDFLDGKVDFGQIQRRAERMRAQEPYAAMILLRDPRDFADFFVQYTQHIAATWTNSDVKKDPTPTARQNIETNYRMLASRKPNVAINIRAALQRGIPGLDLSIEDIEPIRSSSITNVATGIRRRGSYGSRG